MERVANNPREKAPTHPNSTSAYADKEYPVEPERDRNTSAYRCHICLDYVFFGIMLALVLIVGLIVISLTLVYVQNLPFSLIRAGTAICYGIWGFLVVVFYLLYYFRGSCIDYPPIRGLPRVRNIFCHVAGILLVVFIIIVMAFSVHFSLFSYSYKFDNNDQLHVVRVGFVGPDSISLFAYAASASSLQFQYRPYGNASWITPSGGLVRLPSAPITFAGLTPNTLYDYQVLQSGETSPAPRFAGTLRTAPAFGEHTAHTFIFGSCYSGSSMTGPVKYPAFGPQMDPFSKARLHNPAFILFLGDFIYADDPMYIGATTQAYEIKYRQAMASKPYQENSYLLPMVNMYDDHEIVDNFDANETPFDFCWPLLTVKSSRCYGSNQMYTSAMTAYEKFLHSTNPRLGTSRLGLPPPNGIPSTIYFFDFVHADTAFFVADARGYRQSNKMHYKDPAKVYLGEIQLQYLFSWLLAAQASPDVIFKFIAFGDPVTNFIYPEKLGCDGYSQFQVERERLFNFITDNGITNVHILTGDLHVPFVAEIRPGLFEFGSSPMSSFSNGESKFTQAKGPPAIRDDVALVFTDESDVRMLSKASTFITTIDINSTVTPATMRVRYYHNDDQTNPVFDRNFTAV